MLYKEKRQEICEIAKLMFDRNLTNAAGGNIAYKIDDNTVLMTPTLMAEDKFCNLKPEEVLVLDSNLEKIEGEGGITRESNMHMGIFKNLPLAKASLHAHPKEAMVFACSGADLPSMTEPTDALGTVPTLPYAQGCSEELADLVVKHFFERKRRVEKSQFSCTFE